MKRMRIVILAMALIITLGFSPLLFAQNKYPNQTIQIIVPQGPGGGSDMAIRSMSDSLSKILAVPVAVVNRPGAGGVKGADEVAHSQPDGYTFLFASSGVLTCAPAFDPKVVLDLDPILVADYQPQSLTTRIESEFKSLEDIITIAKKRPGTVTVGSTGVTSEPYFALVLFKNAAGINVKHISIANSSEGIANVLGGHVDFWLGSMSTPDPLLRGGKLTGIAITGKKRLETFPNIPTFAEKGFPQVDVVLTHLLLGPKNLPPNVFKTIQNAFKAALEEPAVVASLTKMNYVPDLQTDVEKIKKWLKADLDRFTEIAINEGLRK